MRNNRQLDRYWQDFRLKLAFGEQTPMLLHIVAGQAAGQEQLELFTEARLGPEPEPADDDDSAGDEKTAKKADHDHDPRRAIVLSALKAATTPAMRRRLHGGEALTVVVEVPSPDWVKPVEDHFDAIRSEDWVTFARDGSNKSRDKATVGNSEAAKRISAGRRVVGISANPTVILPTVLQAAADVTIKITAPTGAMVRDALKRCLRGRLPGHIDNKVVAGLDFDDLVAAMRWGSTPLQAVDRMRAVSNRRNEQQGAERFPLLENAVEYGEAQKWCLALAHDLDEYRNKRLSWDRISSSVIWHSIPGCGKSVLAGSLSQALRIPILRVSIADYFTGDSHLGIVLQEQRAAFQKARSLAAVHGFCLMFIDEIDALPSRASLAGNSRASEFFTPIVNDALLLVEQARKDFVILCAATNRINSIDEALLRPGRFDKVIEIGPPNLPGAINVMRFHLDDDLREEDITEVARQAEGRSAAELMDVVRSARRRARQAQRALTLDDLKAQIQGEQDEPPAVLRRIAVHEAAHAVTTVVLSVGELLYVTLQSRGTSGGHTKVRSVDADLMTLADIERRVISILSAGVAERILLSSKSVGSGGTDTSDDGICTTMISVLYASTSLTGEFFHLCSSDEALATVRADPRLRHLVEQHLRRLEKRATDLVERYSECIDAVAKALAKSRYLTGDEVIAVLQAADYLKLTSTEGADAC
jgi:cell division protease FtsH